MSQTPQEIRQLANFVSNPLSITSSGVLSEEMQDVEMAPVSIEVSGGEAPYKFTITAGSLPTGTTLSSTTGAISGTPTATGTFIFAAKVVDKSGRIATAAGLRITVDS